MDVTQSKVNPNCENWTDPFQFSAYRLENGISVLRHADFIPITTVFVYIPFGYAHSIPPNPGGSAHMLEHLITSQSMSSDRLGQFHQQVGLCGGWANAGVASLFTMFVMSVPNQHFDALLPQFAPMIFVPSWEDDQIIKERSIIRNERTSREKWYPGKNPMSYIWQTRWQFDCPYSLEQKMGSDEDLSLMTNDALRELHQHYFSSGITVIAYGPGDITPLTSYLEQLPVGHIELSKSHEPMRWVKKEFGEIDINHIPVYQLTYGGFVTPLPDAFTTIGLDFIVKYLTNTAHGALFQWLRQELGWVYHISESTSVDAHSFDWSISLPLNNEKQVEEVRSEIWQRVAQALDDEEGVNTEVDRRLGRNAFLASSPINCMEQIQVEFASRRIITPLSEQIGILETFRDKNVLQQLFREYFNSEKVGSICFSPAT